MRYEGPDGFIYSKEPNAMMTKQEQYDLVQRTATTSYDLNRVTGDMLHGAMGASTEANEILDHLKAVIFYNKPLDTVNLKEEIGDLLWFIILMCRDLGIDIAEAIQIVNSKLKARYPDKFTEDKAINRDLKIERSVLEGKNPYDFE